MLNLLLVLVANFVNIFARAFQQQNVMHGNYRAVYPTSQIMAFLEVITYGSVAIGAIDNGLFSWYSLGLAIALGIGGAAGCMSSMWVHKKYIRRSGAAQS